MASVREALTRPHATQYSLSSDKAHSALAEPVQVTPTLFGPQPRVLKAEEIAKHKSPGKGVWLAIDGKVYDVERYLDEHVSQR